jgi:hypothetical protein
MLDEPPPLASPKEDLMAAERLSMRKLRELLGLPRLRGQ